MRVKLVIISRSDGSTVSRLMSKRICSDSDSGRPSPEMAPSARLSAPGWPPAGEMALGVPVAGVAAGAAAGAAGAGAWAVAAGAGADWACAGSGRRVNAASRARSATAIPQIARRPREGGVSVTEPAHRRRQRPGGASLVDQLDAGAGDGEEQALALELDHRELRGGAERGGVEQG